MDNAQHDPEEFARRLIGLYGGPDAAREALDRGHREVLRRWNQDLTGMGRILRAHLFVEYYLNTYLEACNPNLGNTGAARLSFAQKAVLAECKTSSEAYLFPGIRRLNQVRNRLAHTMLAEITVEDRDVFLSVSLFREMRKALKAPESPSDEPLVVLEDFARHAGLSLNAASSPDRGLWEEAIWGSV